MVYNYDSWKLASPYDTDYPDLIEQGWIHKDSLPDFENTRDFLVGMQEALYRTGDIMKLEIMLEELCYQFDVEFESKDPKIEKK